MERARRIINKTVEVLTRGSRAREQQRQQFEAARAHIASRQRIAEDMVL